MTLFIHPYHNHNKKNILLLDIVVINIKKNAECKKSSVGRRNCTFWCKAHVNCDLDT